MPTADYEIRISAGGGNQFCSRHSEDWVKHHNKCFTRDESFDEGQDICLILQDLSADPY